MIAIRHKAKLFAVVPPPPPTPFEPYSFSEPTAAAPPVSYSDSPSYSSPQRLEHIVTENMPFTKSLRDVRELIRSLGFDLPHYPRLSRIIFKHIFEEYRNGETWTTADIGAFLQDPTLNASGSKNCAAMVKSLSTRPGSMEFVEEMFNMLTGMLWRGYVPRSEISAILRLVPKIRVTNLKTQDFSDVHVACYEALLDGMMKCGVLQPKDLGKRTLSAWLMRLLRMSPSRYSLNLSKDLLRVLSTTQKTGCRAWLQAFFVHTVKVKARFSPPMDSGPHLKGFRKYVMDIGMMRHLFGSRLIWESILGVTKSLLLPRRNCRNRRTLLLIWAHLLERSMFGSLFKLVRNHILRLPSGRSRFSSYPSRRIISSGRSRARRTNLFRQDWIMRLWLVRIMSRKIRYSEMIEAHRGQLRKTLLKRDRRTRKVPHLSLTDAILQRYKRLGLPYTDLILKPALTPFEQKLRAYPHLLNGLHTTLAQPASRSTPSSKTTTPSQPYWIPSKEDLVQHGEKLLWKLDVTSPDFANHVLLFTETQSDFRSDLLWILRRHVPFKIGLAYSWNAPSRDPLESLLTGARTKTFDGYPILRPEDCLATIHSMALIFSCSDKLTPQVSYRLTKWCYDFLLDHDAPIRPTMIRALYHAGIFRWSEAGQPIPSGRWASILNKIREVEGDGVANTLGSRMAFERFRNR